MILSKVLSKGFARRPRPARALYEAIVAAARQTDYYENLGAPDTVDGRFDMIVLHLFLVFDRLKDEKTALPSALADEFFKDMDRSLREMGVGDLSVGKKVRKMGEAYQGRIEAYREAILQGQEALTAAIARNVYVGKDDGQAVTLAGRVRDVQAKLQSQSVAALEKGTIRL